MANTLEERVAALEAEMAQLRGKKTGLPSKRAWLEDFCGKFNGDPIFASAVKLGQEYRKSLRPSQKSKLKK